MTTEDEVKALCGQLVQIVEIIMNPQVPQYQRIEAYNKCEDFKTNSPMVVQCGLALCQLSYPSYVRHFGLKLLEEVIKLHWNSMTLEQKIFLKENVLRLAASGTDNLMSEMTYIKDAISRLVVEIIKREWPQHWPTLLSELDHLSQAGETQTEMVMLIFLRLVEDVAVLQNLEQPQRRKEIYQALTANMDQIFKFLLQLLEKHYTAYQQSSAQVELSNNHCKVCQAILNTFSAFVEWVAMSHIMANDKYLIKCLCVLLSDENLQMYAAECLLNIVSWKTGKVQDRLQLLSLFQTDMMAPLFDATERANEKALEEKHYSFLKKMVQVFVELGGQLAALWGKEGSLWEKTIGGKRPANFDKYLNALLAFSNHPSQTVNLYVNELWAKFFRHSDISADEMFRTFIPKWVGLAVKRCVKLGYPTMTNHPSCSYSLLDFDSDEEFSAFFGKYRIIITEGIKLISVDKPMIPFQHVQLWLKQILTNLNLNLNAKYATTSPVYLELEAVALVLEATLGKLDEAQLKELFVPCAELYKLCLDLKCIDSTLKSVILSCISALFVVVPYAKDALLQPTLNTIFSCITWLGGKEMGSFDNEVKMLRRHGCALMVKLGTKHAPVLLSIFDHLRDTVVSMKTQNQILPMEFSTLVEALVLISNEFKNYGMQSGFINTISEPVCQQFRNLETILNSPLAFIQHVGLTTPANDSTSQAHRSEIMFCLNFILSVCRRASCPCDITSCQNGGFILSQNGEHVALKNPAWKVASSVLNYVFMFTRTMNHLWDAEIASKLHPDFAQVLHMLESEKNAITGVGNREENSKSKLRTPVTRVQTFLFEIYENNYHFLSQLCTTFGYEFYQTPQLASNIIGSVMHGIEVIPDFRLRAIVRMFLKSLINKCPRSAFSSVLAPVFEGLCPYMLNRLTERWKYLQTIRESPSFDENNADSQEVLDDVVCRHLTREYLDVVKAILTSGGGCEIPISNLTVNKKRSDSNSNVSVDETPKHNGVAVISDLGKSVLQHENLGQCIITTLLTALVWPDSPSSVRAANLLELVLPPLAQSGRLHDSHARDIMVFILKAIHELGQHENNNITLIQLAVQTYELLRPNHPSIVNVLAEVPGCNPEDLKRFDNKMVSIINGKENVKGGDKAKKDMFKKLISQFIGKDIAKMFRHEIEIKNLPTLQVPKTRPKNPGLDEVEHHNMGLGSLFVNNTSHI